HELYLASLGILRVHRDLEAKVAAHCEHGTVLGEHLAFDALEPFGAGILYNELHQRPAETAPLEVGAQQYRIFAALVVGVRVEAHDPPQLASGLRDGNKGHGSRIVDLCEAGDEGVAQRLDRRKETQPQILFGYVSEKRLVEPLVFGTNRPQQDLRAIAQG